MRLRFWRAQSLATVGLLSAISMAARSQVLVAGPDDAPPAEVVPGFTYFGADHYLFDDNLFRVPSGYPIDHFLGADASRSDRINHASVGIDDAWVTDRQSVILALRLNHDSFDRYQFLDNTSESGHVLWNWSAGSRLTGQASADQARQLVNFGYERLFEKDLINTVAYAASGRFQVGPNWALTGATRHTEVDHSVDALQVNNIQNTSGAFGVEYAVSETDTLEAQYKYAQGGYPRGLIVSGIRQGEFHDSTIGLLLHYEPSDKTEVLANAGYLRRTYPIGDANAFSGDVWHLSFKWDPTAHIDVLVAAGRDLKAYVDQASSYFVDKEGSIDVTYSPRTSISVAAVFSVQDEDYIKVADAPLDSLQRRDQLRDEKLTLSYLPRSWLTLDFSLGLEQRNSNDLNLAFHDRLASVGFKVSR